MLVKKADSPAVRGCAGRFDAAHGLHGCATAICDFRFVGHDRIVPAVREDWGGASTIV